MIPNDQSTRVRVNGGGLSAFDFDFGYFNNTDIKVYSIDTTVDPEVATLLTLTTDYTITADAEQGGTVTLTSATEATGEDILILLDLPYTQDTDIPAGGAFREEAIENALDKLTLLAKQNATKIARALSLDETTSITALTFGDPVDGRALKFNDEGSGAWSVQSSAYDPDEAGTYATAAAASASSAATSLSGAQAAELAAEAAQTGAAASLSAVQSLASTVETDINTAGATQLAAVNAAGSTQTAGVNSAGTTALADIATAKEDALDAITGATNIMHLTGAETAAGVKTFSSSPIVPTPTTDYQAATKEYVDDSVGTKKLGSWENRSVSTVYLASTDGFVVASVYADANADVLGYSDSSATPTTLIARCRCDTSGTEVASITFPVRKGDYWRVADRSDSSEHYRIIKFIPFGA